MRLATGLLFASLAAACLYDKPSHQFYCALNEGLPPDSLYPGATVNFCAQGQHVLKTEAGRPYCGSIPAVSGDLKGLASAVAEAEHYGKRLETETNALEKQVSSLGSLITQRMEESSKYIGELQIESSRLKRLLINCGCYEGIDKFGRWSKVTAGDQYIQGEVSTYGKSLPRTCKIGERFSLDTDDGTFTLYECSTPDRDDKIKSHDAQQPQEKKQDYHGVDDVSDNRIDRQRPNQVKDKSKNDEHDKQGNK